ADILDRLRIDLALPTSRYGASFVSWVGDAGVGVPGCHVAVCGNATRPRHCLERSPRSVLVAPHGGVGYRQAARSKQSVVSKMKAGTKRRTISRRIEAPPFRVNR